jgi:acetyl esterase/lipase
VHGGAWRAGDRKDMPLTALTTKGYCVASIDYRLTTKAPFPANIHDIKAAIRFLRAHAEEYAIDPNRIALAGSSAGGHLALLAALTTGNEALEGTVGKNDKISSQVQAVVSFYGASDLTTILSQSTPHGLSVRVPALELLYGGPAETKPELARLASPVFHLDLKDPPILLFHGDQDNQMPHAQSVGLHAACQAAGIACEFHSVPGGEHGGAAFFGSEMLQEVDRFLTNRLKSTH